VRPWVDYTEAEGASATSTASTLKIQIAIKNKLGRKLGYVPSVAERETRAQREPYYASSLLDSYSADCDGAWFVSRDSDCVDFRPGACCIIVDFIAMAWFETTRNGGKHLPVSQFLSFIPVLHPCVHSPNFFFWHVIVKNHAQILKVSTFGPFVPHSTMRYVDAALSSFVYLLVSLLRCFIIVCLASV